MGLDDFQSEETKTSNPGARRKKWENIHTPEEFWEHLLSSSPEYAIMIASSGKESDAIKMIDMLKKVEADTIKGIKVSDSTMGRAREAKEEIQEDYL